MARLRAQTKEQSQQFQDLAMRIDEFSEPYGRASDNSDKKIRILAYETSKDKKLPLGIGGSDHETRIKGFIKSRS